MLNSCTQLPCSNLICKELLNETDVVQKNKIKCSTFREEFQVKDNDFKSNKLIQKQIDDQIFLREEGIALKQKIEAPIISRKIKLDIYCHKRFQELRFQLDQHREQLKEKIDDIYMEMIDKTKEFEASYLKSLNEKLSSSLISFKIN